MPTRYFKIENFSEPGLSISGVSPHALREQSVEKGGDEDTPSDWEFENERFSYLFITYTRMRLLLSYWVRQKGIAFLQEQNRTNRYLMHLYNILQGSVMYSKKKIKEPSYHGI